MAIKAEVVAIPKRKKLRIMAELNRWPCVSIVILVALLVVIAFAPILTPHSPYTMELPNRLLPPAWEAGGSPEFLLGTDTIGRDMLTRIYYGARVTMAVASLVMLLSGVIGLLLGIVAGYMGGWVDAVISRAVDSFLALPGILLALVFSVTLGPGMTTLIIAITAVTWCRFTRVIRGEVIALKSQNVILQAKVTGCSTLRIMLVHILPNVLNTFVILATLNLSMTILIEASLSFLGAGIQPPTPSWGQMVSEGKGYINTAWWVSVFPGGALALTVLAFQLFGDWLRDKLDPKLRQL